MEVSKSEELMLLRFEDRESLDAVTFGSAICLQTNEGSFLTFNANGELRVEKNSRYEVGNNNIAKLTKWTIVDAKNVTNRDLITPFDDVCLKSPFGHYFVVEQSGIISANGP